MVRYLRERTDDELQQIRPFELAALWGLDRRAVLGGFLHAARAGLFDLHWQTICPTCRVGSALHAGLSEVGTKSYCEACDAHFMVDFAANIEAVFQANPAVRPTTARVWCASSPWFRPHVFAVIEVAPGTTRDLGGLPAEALVVHSGANHLAATLDGARGAELHLGAEVLTATPGEPGGVLRVHNTSESTEQLVVERAAYRPEAALGNELITLPEFHDLFAMDAPAAGVDLGVSSVAILFCDLTASTALYRDIGDGRAFAIINDHFNALAAIVEQHRGAVLKTMGDAVMAAFLSSSDAMAAAVEMIRAVATLHAHHDMRLKVGMHEGPALAVRANQRLDFFGTTVNLAARLQEEAEADQIVIAAALLDHPDIAALTQQAGSLVHQRITPKGLPPLPCVKLTVSL
jgi:class 3 adenylate cyclase